MTDKEKAMLEALPPGPPEQSRAWCQGFRSGWDVALSASSGWVSVSENRLSDGGVYWITFVIEGQYVVSERTYRPDEFPSNTVAYMQAPKPAEPFTPRGEQSMSDKCKCGHGEKYHHDGKGIWAKGCNQPLAMELGCPCTQFTPADDPAPDMVEKAREFAAQGDHGVDEYWLATKLADFAAQVTADKEKQIRKILTGIDKTEIESDDGWWETSAGAAFGSGKLTEILALVSSSHK